MSCNCKGKREGNDLKLFKLISQLTQELLGRTNLKVRGDITMSSKIQLYRQLFQALKRIDDLTGGKLSQ